MEFLSSLLGRSGLLPHGVCISWSPGLLWSMVGADAVIAAAYFSIPLAIVHFVRRRGSVPMPGLIWLFCAFIFACGITHALDIWTLWQPDYGLQVLAKMATATVSLATAVVMWPLVPRALKIPSVAQLQAVIDRLEAEVRMRRTAEDHLNDVQESLAVALASIDAGFIATDRAGRVVHMNAVAERLTGWREAEAVGQLTWDVFRREDRPADVALRNPVDVMIERGVTAATTHHVVVLARDGTRHAVEVNADLTHHADGSISGMAMVFRDVTQLNRDEAERRRLVAIVESSSDAIVGKTLEGRITSWNGAAQALFGWSTDEAIGMPVQRLIPPDRQDEEMHILARVSEGHTVGAFDTVRLTREGRRVEVSVTISPIHDALGRIVGASKIARDLSYQRRTESALRESETRLRVALEAGQIGDWELDITSGETRRSIRHDRCFGYSEPQAEWGPGFFLRRVHPDDRERVKASFRAATQQQHDWHDECRVLWPDHSVHHLSLHAAFVRDEEHGHRLVGVVTDVTAQKEAEESRLKALRLEAENRQMQEASRMKSLFLANMSHELRTPLNAVIGFADLLCAGTVKPDSPKFQQYLGHIAASGRHLLQLINDVLDLSKIESGKLSFKPQPLELAPLVREIGQMLQPSIERKRLVFSTDIDTTLGTLQLDPVRLRQVLFNYLTNAIKFTGDGGSVTLRARAEGATLWRLEVEDSGIGIAPEDQARLFVEFQQLDAGFSKQFSGTGLGLALTRRLVEAQGGQVGVRSTPGVGSVFHAVLPRQHRPDEAGGTDAALPADPALRPARAPGP